MKPADWIKIAGMLIAACAAILTYVVSMDHTVQVNTSDIERVEEVNEKQEVAVEKLETKAAAIDTKLVQIQTQQTSNQRILEKMDRKMDRVLKR
jgi:hypothetical protein